jgi:tetratricopeptide (TPR) repeat protein
VALDKAAQAQTIEDFENIKPLLKTPVFSEISSQSTSSRSMMSAELAENILSSPKKMEQIEDIKMCLKSIIEEKEKKRGGLFAILDRINTRIFSPTTKVDVKKLKIQIMKFLAITKSSSEDKKSKQRAYYDLGNAYIQLSDISNAEECFLKAISVDPKSDLGIKARFNLGWAYKNFGRYEEAVAVFGDLSREFPELELGISSKYQIADTVYKKGDHNKARDKYAELSEENPGYKNSDMGLFQAGYISLYDLNDKDTALKYFARLKERFSNSPISIYADVQINGVIAYDYRRTGFEFLRKKRYADAIENFKKAVDYLPSDAGSLGGMGLAFFWANNKEEAINSASRTFGLKTKDETAYANSLYLYIMAGMTDEAIKNGEWVLSKHKIKIPEFYYNLGCAYLKRNKVADAINMFKIVVKKNPRSLFARNNLACGLWLTSRYAEAIDIFLNVLDIDPLYVPARFNLGIVYFYTGELEKSWKEFKKLISNVTDKSSEERRILRDKASKYVTRIEDHLQYQPEA